MAWLAYSSVISVLQPATLQFSTGAPSKVPNCGYYDSDTDTKWRDLLQLTEPLNFPCHRPCFGNIV